MAEQLAELKVQRATTKGCISRIKTFVEQKADTLTPPEIECRLGILESYFKQALSYQTSIERLAPTDANEVKVRSELEEAYCSIKSKLLSLRSDTHKQSLDSSQIVVTSPPINNLPKLKLPQFSGKYSEFQNFWGCFTKLVHKNETLTDLERFNPLLSCLSGAALRTVKALEISEENYSKALDHLKARYDNRYLIFQEHIVDLFNLPKISKTSPDQLRHLIDSANAHLSALKSLGSSEDIANAFLIHIVTSKLDYESQDSWEAKVDFSTLPSWSNCFDTLSKRCQYLESRDSKSCWSGGTSSHNERSKQRVGKKPSIHATTLTTTNNSCTFCSGSGHNIYKCQNFLALPVSERFNETKRRSLCVNCLSKGHTVKKCRVQKCRVCSMPHHTLLHRYNLPMAPQADLHVACPVDTVNDSRPNRFDNRAVANNTTLQTLLRDKNSDHVFLATAIIKVRDKFGCEHQARVLLDSASQLNFITERFAQYLQLSRTKVETSISGIGDTSSRIRYSTQGTIQSLTTNFQTSLQMYIIPNITGSQPERKIDISNWGIPGNVQLADPLFFEPQEVDLLVGADLFFQLLCVGQIKLSEGLPILQKTLFGWIVAGRYTSRLTPTKYSGYPVHEERKYDESPTDVTLFNLVERFWAEEDLGKPMALHTDEQELCEAMFKEKVQRLSDGKFMVKLPFRNEPRQFLGQSLRIARSRLQSLERKLDKNPKLKENYAEFLQDYLESGHMEAIEMENIPELHYFMPHQCVIRPESTTTKLRVVFDASCKTSSNNSLNDLLMTGPTVQDDIFSIILRFRSYKFALTADIQQMYRQILVYPEDRNFQLILWRASHSDNLQVFKLNTITYGTASAPFLATRCLIQLAEDFSSTRSEASRIIQKDFYMDDLITGADTSENLHRIKEEVDVILSSAQFKLRKWYSNDADLLSKIPEDAREKPLKFNDIDIVKTLGIVWDPAADNFKFNYKPSTNGGARITKRKVLSDTASLFDPLGIINPIIVKAKVFLQELWILKLNWDESLPMELENRWMKFIEELSQLQYLEVPRLAFSSGCVTTTELHGYADASIRAYGCCLYIRSIDTDGHVTTTLLATKSKVAPIRTARSLPCLELCAALLLSRLLKKIRTSLDKTVDQTFLWTDSEIVLDWLACHPSMWKAYVANRVSEIQELTKDSIWRHVNSKANPADIISRGSSVAELSNSIWFSGPVYLQQPPDFWPINKARRNYDIHEIPEKRKVKTILTCSTSEHLLEKIYSCSDFLRNCRRIALILRFAKNYKLKKENGDVISGPLSATEIDNALLRIVSCIQRKEFSEQMIALEEKELSAKSNMKSLNPFVDDSLGYRLLRVGGRLRNANLPYESKFPILLPQNNPFVRPYIKYLHFKNFHAGPLALVAIVRQRFWVINARDYTRKIVRSCLHCFKYRPKLVQQIMGDLPSNRVTSSAPFNHSGVDFCGPFNTTYRLRGKQTYKSYVAVFVCFTTKAVHIEVVSDLTSESFIGALKRFIGRRNLCEHIYCDNATNFVGARRKLQEFKAAFYKQQTQGEISQWCSNNGIDFHHIPPRSPHFGGLWEAAIKSAKAHLYRTLQASLLTFEELTTVMVQIEAVLNSRPITPLSSDPSDEEALTPAHFLVQAPINYFPEPDLSKQKINYLHRWQRISALLQHFWRRWSREYVSSLQERFRWQVPRSDVTKGMLVLIHQDDLPPFKWKLGRVVKTSNGPDGHVRIAEIRTSTGIIQRAVHKIAPLPVEAEV